LAFDSKGFKLDHTIYAKIFMGQYLTLGTRLNPSARINSVDKGILYCKQIKKNFTINIPGDARWRKKQCRHASESEKSHLFSQFKTKDVNDFCATFYLRKCLCIRFVKRSDFVC
jgi:hypothetical protein